MPFLLSMLAIVIVFGILSFFLEFGEVIIGLVIVGLVAYALCMLAAPVETQKAIMGLIDGTREILHNVKEGTKAPPL
jgi:hypothetical protein